MTAYPVRFPARVTLLPLHDVNLVRTAYLELTRGACAAWQTRPTFIREPGSQGQ